MKDLFKLLALIVLIGFLSCRQNQQSGSPSATPAPPPYKLKMSCNEPFITIKVREDLNQIEITTLALTPTSGSGPATFQFPYSPPASVAGGFNVFYTGGTYNGQNLDYIVKYKTAVPANSCIDDMAGTPHALQGFISVSTNGSSYATYNACGDLIP